MAGQAGDRKLITWSCRSTKSLQPCAPGEADVGLIIHEGQLTYQKEGLQVCEDLGAWWGRENEGLPLPLGGNVIHKRFAPATRARRCRTC